jgi:NAD(P)H-hydrate epimerase
MENAGSAIAEVVENFIETNDLPKNVTLLVGKGNNGGDAFAAGAKLIERGFTVIALPIYPLDSCGPLCKTLWEKFRSRGGSIKEIQHFGSEGVILDGLVGTGFKGKAEGVLAQAIESANRSGLPILAIDIPSGLNGTTGEVGTVAIQATETISLGLPKSGFFLKDGWDHVGTLRYASFGLGEKYIARAKPLAFLLNDEALPGLLPPIKRSRHKYEAGYVLAIAGSPGMPGAALLSSYAVLRAGAGIVRLFHPSGMEEELSGAPFELIRQGWDGKKMRVIAHEALRAKSMLIGPGISRTTQAKKMVQKLLENIDLPMVIDADALFFLAKNSAWKLPKGSVLTPHRGEMDLLLGKEGKQSYQELCQAYAEEKNVTVVLKGAPTYVYHPRTTPIIVTRGDPGMATAGSGDVLTGVIAALMAQGLDARCASALGVYLHGVSGEAASSMLTSYCMTASDLIDFLPEAFRTVYP